MASRRMAETQFDDVWTMIHEHLQKEMRRLHEEIRNYPAPIPACDAQFNYLLEQRDALSSELTRARELMSDNGDPENPRVSIDEFLNVSDYLGEAEKSEIRAVIENENWSREGDQ